MGIRHFLTLADLDGTELQSLLRHALDGKRRGRRGAPLPGRVLAMIFEKSSTRTRVSFETAMAQLGGHAIFIAPADSQLGRGESVEDTARVLSHMVDAVMIRTFGQDRIERFARAASVPVINGLTDTHHPCQLLADLLTFEELRGPIGGRRVAWIGDGNNMCNSYLQAARLLDFHLSIASPEGFGPDAELLAAAADRASIAADPLQAARGAHLVVTDVWASMGQEQDAERRRQAFAGYQVNEQVMKAAAADALFMHCLPAHRGEEVSAGVLDGPQSVVWEEAGNRLHAQKALLEFLLR